MVVKSRRQPKGSRPHRRRGWHPSQSSSSFVFSRGGSGACVSKPRSKLENEDDWDCAQAGHRNPALSAKKANADPSRSGFRSAAQLPLNQCYPHLLHPGMIRGWLPTRHQRMNPIAIVLDCARPYPRQDHIYGQRAMNTAIVQEGSCRPWPSSLNLRAH
jgi:hypothetical protein